MNHLPLLTAAAALGKPLILSTGASHPSEIEQALTAIEAAGGDRVVLLQCTG